MSTSKFNGHSESNSELESLAWTVATKAFSVSEFLEENGLPQPSFQPDAPASVLPNDAPKRIQGARQELLAGLLKLFNLAVGPSDFLPHLATNMNYISCIQWLCTYDIFHLVPLETTISYEELSKSAGVSQQRLKSIVRMAITTSLFSEDATGTRIGHSSTSAYFASNEDAHAYASYMTSRTAPMALKMTEAHKTWGTDTTKPSETAYNIAFNTPLPLFQDLKQSENRTQEFARYMKSVRSSDGVALRHLVSGFDWGNLPDGSLVVDVGGSTGTAATALATANPQLKFVVQDLPENVEAGRKTATETVADDISSRLTFQAHDFQEPQPVLAAEIYLLRMILHDWPDDSAITILRCLVEAMDPNKSRLLIMDTVLPTPGSVPTSEERIARARDLTMMQSFNSRERELEDWLNLIKAADPRLQLVEVRHPTASAMSILELGLSE